MNAEQFAYWLQGSVELSEWKQPTPEQWKSICEHLQTVFNKVTPSVFNPVLPQPFMPSPVIGPNQTYIPTPLYEPRITC